MSNPSFDNIMNKVKEATRQAADQTNKAARVAKLKMTMMSLQTEKLRHFQTIGQKAFTLFSENKSIDGSLLQSKVMEELKQIERIDAKILEMENEISTSQHSGQIVEIKDVTDETGKE